MIKNLLRSLCMGGHLFRNAKLLTISVCLLLDWNVYANDALERRITFDLVENTPLDRALILWSAKAGIPIIIDGESATALKTKIFHGRESAGQLLAFLLQDSGLTYYLTAHTVQIIPAHAAPLRTSYDSYESAQSVESDSNSKKRSQANDDSGQPESHQRDIEEVIVSAEKRTEALSDVPVPVTVLGADALVESNQLRLQDYFSQVSGLSYTTDGRGAPSLAIRGLATSTGFSNPTVGIVVDDVPYGSSTGLGGGSSAPDIDPSDLARVEVLRGPQGTLYGASSLGGLVKFVTVDPSTDRFGGNVQASANSVYNAEGPGFSGRGSINVPISETFALRASGFARRDTGYIDNVLTGQDGVNRVQSEGGRLSALWRPADIFSLKIGALYQYSRTSGSANVEAQPDQKWLQQSEVRDSGIIARKVQVYNATAVLKLGAWELTSTSGYSLNSIADSNDFSYLFGGLAQQAFSVLGSVLSDRSKTNKVIEEFRITGPVTARVDWLLGAFYTHEHSPYTQEILAAVPDSGAIAGSLAVLDFPTTFTEYAAFTDFTFKLNDQIDIQLGGRESRNKQTYSEIDSGALIGGVSVQPQVDTDDSSFTYLVTPRFRINSDLMVYARFASGYRPGGPNSTCTLLGVPCKFGPDKTNNYELGLKGDIADHMLELDTSIYYIDWKDLQLSLAQPVTGLSYYANGGAAKSKGIELASTFRPVSGLKISAWVSWNDAVLKEALPMGGPGAAYGAAGDRLPFSSRISGNLSVQEEFPITHDVSAFVGASVSYVGDRKSFFTAPPPDIPPRQEFPGYAKADAHAGLTFNDWTTDTFVNNLANRRGVLSGGLGTSNPNAFQFIQPRTVGVTISKSF